MGKYLDRVILWNSWMTWVLPRFKLEAPAYCSSDITLCRWAICRYKTTHHSEFIHMAMSDHTQNDDIAVLGKQCRHVLIKSPYVAPGRVMGHDHHLWATTSVIALILSQLQMRESWKDFTFSPSCCALAKTWSAHVIIVLYVSSWICSRTYQLSANLYFNL